MTRIKLIVLFICLISLPAFSQSESPETGLSKGNWMIGGTAWFTEHQSFNNVEFSIDPKVGYFLGEKLVIGLNTSYTFDGVKNSQSGNLGPFARYYFVNRRVAPFIEAQYNLGRSRTQIEFSPKYESSFSHSYGPAAGLDIFISKNVAFESTLKYLCYDGVEDMRLSINFGFQIFFNRSK